MAQRNLHLRKKSKVEWAFKFKNSVVKNSTPNCFIKFIINWWLRLQILYVVNTNIFSCIHMQLNYVQIVLLNYRTQSALQMEFKTGKKSTIRWSCTLTNRITLPTNKYVDQCYSTLTTFRCLSTFKTQNTPDIHAGCGILGVQVPTFERCQGWKIQT